MQKRLWQLFTCVKEHSSVKYAQIATAGGFCDVDLIIVKATAPDDLPLPDKYVAELLKIFSISPSSLRAFSLSFTRRFGKTHCWRVALKCLILLHRLLRSLPEDSPFRAELIWSRTNSLFSLHPCHFRDESSSRPEDYTAFIRSYAQLLDEALDCLGFDGKATYDHEEEIVPESLSDKMDKVCGLIKVLTQLQSLIDRVMDCRPTGAAARNFIVQIAMKHIIRDSFSCYTTFRRGIVLVLDNLFQMPYRSCTVAFGIYKKAEMQANQLCEFYDCCKAMGLCGAHEYPFVDRIPQIQIQALGTFLNGMWQLTESSSSSSTSSPSSTLTPNPTKDDGDKQVISKDIVISTEWVKFEENGFPRNLKGEEETEPLIKFKDSEDDSWEDLLDASVNLLCVAQSNSSHYSKGFSYFDELGYQYDEKNKGDQDEWKVQVCDLNVVNTFFQPHNVSYHQHGSDLNKPMHLQGMFF